MLDVDLLKNVLIIGISSSVITTAIVQKIKEHLSTKKYIILISFFVSLVIGTLFSLSFSDMNWYYSAWSGLFSFIGADTLYLAFEDKIFKRFSDITGEKEIERTDES